MRPDFLHEVSNFLASSTLAWTITFEPFPAPSATIEFIQDRSLGQAAMTGSAILHHWETLMPLFTVTMKSGQSR